MDNNAIKQYYKTLSDIVLIILMFIVILLHVRSLKYNILTRSGEPLVTMKVLKKVQYSNKKVHRNDTLTVFRTDFVRTMYRQQYIADKYGDCKLITAPSTINVDDDNLSGDWILVGNRRRKRYSSVC